MGPEEPKTVWLRRGQVQVGNAKPVLIWAAITQRLGLSFMMTRNVSLLGLESEKSKHKVPAGSVCSAGASVCPEECFLVWFSHAREAAKLPPASCLFGF